MAHKKWNTLIDLHRSGRQFWKRSESIIALTVSYVECLNNCLTWPPFTAVIGASRFQNVQLLGLCKVCMFHILCSTLWCSKCGSFCTQCILGSNLDVAELLFYIFGWNLRLICVVSFC